MNMTVTNADYGSVGIGGNDGKLGRYASGNADGTEVPVAVMPHELDGASGDNFVRPVISGRVSADRLVVNGGSVTYAELDALRQTAIVPVAVTQLAAQDNQ